MSEKQSEVERLNLQIKQVQQLIDDQDNKYSLQLKEKDYSKEISKERGSYIEKYHQENMKNTEIQLKLDQLAYK